MKSNETKTRMTFARKEEEEEEERKKRRKRKSFSGNLEKDKEGRKEIPSTSFGALLIPISRSRES